MAALADAVLLEELDLSNCELEDINALLGLTNLALLDLVGNQIIDVLPLSRMEAIESLYLDNNAIETLHPLLDNDGLGDGDIISVNGNPLTQRTICDDVRYLRERGVTVALNDVCETD